MTAHKVGEILATTGELRALSRAARRQAELEQLFFSATPRALSEAARIKSFRTGTLIVSADNAAVASKLKLLAPQLLLHIREREPEVTKIRVEVQPTAGAAPTSRKRPITAGTLSELRKLAQDLGESPLKSALTRMVERHKKR